MNKNIRLFQVLFAIPWIVFGIQHFMYADFVATLVPGFMPFKLFFAYFTGSAMIAAGIAFIVNGFFVNKLSTLAAILLGLMLTMFILMIHLAVIAGNPTDPKIWTRPVQDIALACTCFLLVGAFLRRESKNSVFDRIAVISRYLFAIVLIAFGVQQFMNLDFVTTKIPTYFPLRLGFVYFTGIAMIAAGVLNIINKKAKLAALVLGAFMLVINLLNHLYLLANDLHNPILWTAAMLDFAITFGVFILAVSSESVGSKQ